jgi:hypothetical protein
MSASKLMREGVFPAWSQQAGSKTTAEIVTLGIATIPHNSRPHHGVYSATIPKVQDNPVSYIRKKGGFG